jgi:hypothetical protein
MPPILPVAPGEKLANGPVIGRPGVLVADGRREELQEPPGSLIAGVGDHPWHHDAVAVDHSNGPGQRQGGQIAWPIGHGFSVT